MTFTDVTLSPDDVEWVRPVNQFTDLEPFVFDDDAFEAWVVRVGLLVALERFTEFHRNIANQLIAQAVKDITVSDWAGRTIRLCTALKRRRSQLRARTYRRHGQTMTRELIGGFDARWPRAVWGSGTDGHP